MLDKNGKRMLAYVQEIVDVEPLYLCKKDKDGNFIPDLNEKGEKVYADSIEKAHVLGWTLIVNKGSFKPGDKCVFFEIDSKIPAGKFLDENGEDYFEFLARKNYCVKTYKLNKFGVWSQGLAMPLDELGVDPELEINTDLTDNLGVTYAIVEDNFRKSDPRKAAISSYKAKHKKFFNNKFIKSLMKFRFFRWLFLLPMNKGNKDMKKAFPSEFVSKTDEERIQNMPWLLSDKQPFIATEKIDGTSTTFLLVRKNNRRFEFYVCSRNIRKWPEDDCYQNNSNIYWEMAIRYDVENQLKNYLIKNPDLRWVCIQGESYGQDWQGNPLKLKTHEFAAFNFKDSKNGRWGSLEGKKLLESFDKPIPWVPIIDTEFILPDTMEELLNFVTAKSVINPNVLREGIVFRSKDGKLSFKGVSPLYLAKKGE